MDPLPQFANVAHTIQLAVAPVFLFAGIGAFLNLCAGRLARVVDRARIVEERILTTDGAEHDRYLAEIRTLDKRITVVNACMSLSVLSACLTCLVVILLFATQLVSAKLGTLVALLFILSMLAMGVGFALFLVETRLGSRVVHIRNEVLYHRVEK
jgi:MFS family permease